MRFIAPLAALALAGVAWIGCWQEVQLVRLRRQIRTQAAQPIAAVAVAVPVPSIAQAVRTEAHHPAPPPSSPLDQLKELLIERQEAIADARDASAEVGIAEGSPDLDRAILLATEDLDRAIIKLAGPAAGSQLTQYIPRATLPPDVRVAPAPASPVASPSPAYVAAQPANIFVNVAAPAPVVVYEAPPAAESFAPPYGPQQIIYGGLGASFGPPRRNQARKLTETEKARYFAAGAGIPLPRSPLPEVVVTSPVPFNPQRTATVSTGR
jgi:hypothetical protein